MADPAARTLAEAATRLAGAHVLVVGDVMLDRFVHGEVARISPEAPIPVFRVTGEAAMPGGAGNVARNAAALGAAVTLVGVVGDDDEGRALAAMLANEAGITARLVADARRPTTTKTRHVAGGQQLLR
ncbi:MAG: PfkB family carbohydrate kinase, partial [Alphaproteobacteria bacterium]